MSSRRSFIRLVAQRLARESISARAATRAALFSAAALLCLQALPADACQLPRCRGGYFVPASGTVPANLAEIIWAPLVSYDAESIQVTAQQVELVRLHDEEDGVSVPLTVRAAGDGGHVAVSPSWPLEEGASYLLRGADLCRGDGSIGETATTAGFSVGPVAGTPSGLGTLEVSASGSGRIEVAAVTAACSDDLETVWREVALEPSTQAEAWLDALVFETIVDGERWLPRKELGVDPPFGASWIGRGRDRIYAACAENEHAVDHGVPQGEVTVRLSAWFAGSQDPIESEPLDIVLDCDNGEGDDGGSNGGTIDGPPSPGADYVDEGCSAAPAGASSGASLALLFGALLLVAGSLASRSRARGERK